MQYVQVRTKQGGGTRTVVLNKDICKGSIIAEASKLFFPGGISGHRSVTDMVMDLTDFKCQPLDDTTTVGQMVDIAKLSKLRFYLTTRMRHQSPEETVVHLVDTPSEGEDQQQQDHLENHQADIGLDSDDLSNTHWLDSHGAHSICLNMAF